MLFIGRCLCMRFHRGPNKQSQEIQAIQGIQAKEVQENPRPKPSKQSHVHPPKLLQLISRPFPKSTRDSPHPTPPNPPKSAKHVTNPNILACEEHCSHRLAPTTTTLQPITPIPRPKTERTLRPTLSHDGPNKKRIINHRAPSQK